jgi:hypothetical protein
VQAFNHQRNFSTSLPVRFWEPAFGAERVIIGDDQITPTLRPLALGQLDRDPNYRNSGKLWATMPITR